MTLGPEDTLVPWRELELVQRLEWALCPELPAAYREALLQEQWVQTRCYFARRQDLHPEEIALLAQDADYVIRLCIAKRPDLSPEQIESFCHDRDPNVRYAVARNPLLLPEQRTRLLVDIDELVRQAAAKGPRKTQTRQRANQAILYR